MEVGKMELAKIQEGLQEKICKFIDAAEKARPGEIIGININGFLLKQEKGVRPSIWRGWWIHKREELLKRLREGEAELDAFSRALNPKRILILAASVEGASEGELSEITGLKGGALHHHLKELLLLGLLQKTERGKYTTTKYGDFVVAVAASAVPKMHEAWEEVIEV